MEQIFKCRNAHISLVNRNQYTIYTLVNLETNNITEKVRNFNVIEATALISRV